MFSEPVKALIMIALGAILIHRGYVEWKRGAAVTVWALYLRASRPTGFWLNVILALLIGGSAVAAGLASFILSSAR